MRGLHLEAAKPEVKSARKTIKDFEELIEASDDFEFLTDDLLGQLAVSELAPPAMQFLTAKIAKKTNVPKWSLTDVITTYRNGGSAKKLGDYESKIEELNLKHAMLPIGGRIVIMNREYDPVLSRQLLTFSAKTDFETRYCNRKE